MPASSVCCCRKRSAEAARKRMLRRHPGAPEACRRATCSEPSTRSWCCSAARPATSATCRSTSTRSDPFERSVYEIARDIPHGRTLTYGEVAAPARRCDAGARRGPSARAQPGSGHRAVPSAWSRPAGSSAASRPPAASRPSGGCWPSSRRSRPVSPIWPQRHRQVDFSRPCGCRTRSGSPGRVSSADILVVLDPHQDTQHRIRARPSGRGPATRRPAAPPRRPSAMLPTPCAWRRRRR